MSDNEKIEKIGADAQAAAKPAKADKKAKKDEKPGFSSVSPVGSAR